jgi:(p)ppGpp synthase/HD superfamily hydrolase
LLRDAYELARSAHHGPARRGETDIEHPLAVAELLHENGFDEQVVAAALLHDVVEDTALDLASIGQRFGPEISRMVAEMTEDPSIEPYEERKAEHRSRVSRDRRAAAIYAADKLAKARGMKSADEVPSEQLEHYRETLRLLCETHPDLPFLGQLRAELEGLLT